MSDDLLSTCINTPAHTYICMHNNQLMINANRFKKLLIAKPLHECDYNSREAEASRAMITCPSRLLYRVL